MSGHSKWATIKRAKEAKDAKKGAVFTRLAKLITVAAREKGGDLNTNFTLRMAVDKAKAANMPKDNIEKAIKRGTGESQEGEIFELLYEAVGPANTQFVIKGLTDNKNRSAAEIRHLLAKHEGALASVLWNFEQKGVIRIAAETLAQAKLDLESLELDLIDAGAEDIRQEAEGITIITAVADLQAVGKFWEDRQVAAESVALEYVAKDQVELSGAEQEKADKIIDALQEHEDVADYYSNIKD